jgi:hypothetical protein
MIADLFDVLVDVSFADVWSVLTGTPPAVVGQH